MLGLLLKYGSLFLWPHVEQLPWTFQGLTAENKTPFFTSSYPSTSFTGGGLFFLTLWFIIKRPWLHCVSSGFWGLQDQKHKWVLWILNFFLRLCWKCKIQDGSEVHKIWRVIYLSDKGETPNSYNSSSHSCQCSITTSLVFVVAKPTLNK